MEAKELIMEIMKDEQGIFFRMSVDEEELSFSSGSGEFDLLSLLFGDEIERDGKFVISEGFNLKSFMENKNLDEEYFERELSHVDLDALMNKDYPKTVRVRPSVKSVDQSVFIKIPDYDKWNQHPSNPSGRKVNRKSSKKSQIK